MAAAQRKILPHPGAFIVRKIWKIFSIAVGCAVLLLCLYIMINGLGLVEGLDFGAGAYYYADIPDFDKYMHEGAYKSSLPLWVYIVLFLAWGYLMWLLWKWIDKK